MKVKPIETDDGSHSLYVESLDEHYHSTKGALQESRHVFIEAGLKQKTTSPLRVLEIGMGTGLNALLTFADREKEQEIFYTALEKYPLPETVTGKLNYAQLVGVGEEILGRIHRSAWESWQEIGPGFHLKKLEIDLHSWKPTETYDLVYFDAFGPDKQPDMWSVPIYQTIYNAMNPNGLLLTYTAKGAVRRGLQEVGFEVERLQGPPGKKHMTRAGKRL
ncbi:tRNA (5-methylaminomethyl-2-thiouridine)(34)-methyltransferase MnmC2 [Salinivirga cyanobacteriivorans]